MHQNQYPAASNQEILALAGARAADPLVSELAARLGAAMDARSEIELLRARQSQAKAALELVLYRFGAPADVTAALKRILAL